MTMPLTDFERELCEEASADRLMELTRGIARWVRLSGSPEELEAAQYLRGVLDGYGLTTELIFHDAYISLPGPAHVELADGTRLPCITHSFAAPTAGLEGQLVDCRATPPEAAIEKIALLDGLAMAGRVHAVEQAGVAAQIYVNGPITHEMIVSTVWGSPGPDDLRHLPATPVVSVTDEVAERLLAGSGPVRIVAEVDTRWRTTPILLARIEGSTPDFVLFSGHLDSWHHGAMDNGSANATMVEVARILAGHRDRLRRGLLLAFWSGHSHGRYSGSAWFADNRWPELRAHCVAHVNVDSVGGQGASVLSEGIATASLRGVGAEAIGAVTGEEFRGSRVGRSGDQSFLGLGLPSLWMSLSEQPPGSDVTARAFAHLVGDSRSGGLGWWWHTTEDTVDKLDPELLLRDAQVYVAAIACLATARLLPVGTVAEAAELQAQLEELAAAARGRFDLDPCRDRSAVLVDACRRLESWRERRGAAATDAEVAAHDHAVRAVLRALLPVGYTAGGRFQPDRAMAVPALPLLDPVRQVAALEPDSDELRFLSVDLVRRRNRVVSALDEAVAAAEAGLRVLEREAARHPG
jgi:Peptidase family M28